MSVFPPAAGPWVANRRAAVDVVTGREREEREVGKEVEEEEKGEERGDDEVRVVVAEEDR